MGPGTGTVGVEQPEFAGLIGRDLAVQAASAARTVGSVRYRLRA